MAVLHHRLRGSRYNKPTITFLGSLSSTTNLTTYSTGSVTLGSDDDPNRLIVVVAMGAAGLNREISSVTIGTGFSATEVIQLGSVYTRSIGIFQRFVDSGTTINNISINFSASMNQAALSWYSITGLGSLTPRSTNYNQSNSPSTTLSSTSPGGVCIFGGIRGTGATLSWANLTPDFNEVVESAMGASSGGFLATDTSTTDSFTGTSSGIVAAHWY